MKKVYAGTNPIPIKAWLDDIEPGALTQAENLANLPFAFKHIALMPGCHQGYGMPVESVMATEGVVVPNAVGVDIGCGMIAMQTPFVEMGKMKETMDLIRKLIPLGFHKHKTPRSLKDMPKLGASIKDVEYPIVHSEFNNALKSLGTLGGGNHFIEFQKGDDGHIWIMIHSGSRNLGYKVADHYNKLAKKMNKSWYSQIPVKWDLAYLPIDTEEGQDYLREMQYCVEFALCNRRYMMNIIVDIMISQGHFQCDDSEDEFNEMIDGMINIAHNYAQMEHHYGKDVMVHRKGATLARKDTVGIIPGSQGSKSYIVMGKGNPESFTSCSHGAGRKMGRKEAQKTLNLEDEIAHLDKLGVIHSVRTEKDLDEAPGSYKDIQTVMKNQEDLVHILVELEPLAVIKG